MTERTRNRDSRQLKRRHFTVCRRHIKRGDKQAFRRSVRPYLGV